MSTAAKAILNSLALILILSTQVVSQSAPAAQDPAQLQQQGIQRLERVLEYRRKTGDNQSTVPHLRLAELELLTSSNALFQSGNISSAVIGLTKGGLAQRLLDKPTQAHTSFKLAYDISVSANFTQLKVRALLGLAKTELYQSGPHDYQAVAKYLDEALSLATTLGDKEGLCDIWETRADLDYELRDFTAAARSINNSFPYAAELKDQMYLFFAHQSRGMIYSELAGKCDYDRGVGDCYKALDGAKSDYEKAQVVANGLGYDFLSNLMGQGLKNVELKRQQVKLKENENVLSKKISELAPRLKPQDVVNQSFLPPKTSDSSGAELVDALKPMLEKLIERAQDSATGNFLRGSLKDVIDQPDAALAYYLEAVKHLDSDSLNLRDDASIGTFLEDKIQIYYSPMLHLLERKRYAEAFDLMENSRSRAMADLLRKHDVNVRPEDRKLYADYLAITAGISDLQAQLYRDRSKPASAQITQNITANEKKLQALDLQYEGVLKQMSASGSNLLGLVGPQTATLQMLQQSLKKDRSEVLYYVVLDKQTIIWHITADETHVLSVFLPRSELIKKVDSLRKSLSDREEAQVDFNPETSKELFLYLIRPVLAWIKTDHLVIVPHEDLNYVPFQTFYDGEKKQFLGEQFQISYAPSATTFSRLKRVENIRDGNLLAVEGSGLPESVKEVNALGQLFPGHSRIVVNQEVREADVKNWVADYDFIHLSVHGTFNGTRPLLSYLELKPGEPRELLVTRILRRPSGGTRPIAEPNLLEVADDGQLSTAEMFALPLKGARLVVLSACETGQARATRANEVIGMERALLYAGANSLVLSSWKVDPAATELWMTTFYREARSKPLSEAARLALMAVRSDSKYSHPYYWSPFLLIGK